MEYEDGETDFSERGAFTWEGFALLGTVTGRGRARLKAGAQVPGLLRMRGCGAGG